MKKTSTSFNVLWLRCCQFVCYFLHPFPHIPKFFSLFCSFFVCFVFTFHFYCRCCCTTCCCYTPIAVLIFPILFILFFNSFAVVFILVWRYFFPCSFHGSKVRSIEIIRLHRFAVWCLLEQFSHAIAHENENEADRIFRIHEHKHKHTHTHSYSHHSYILSFAYICHTFHRNGIVECRSNAKAKLLSNWEIGTKFSRYKQKIESGRIFICVSAFHFVPLSCVCRHLWYVTE